MTEEELAEIEARRYFPADEDVPALVAEVRELCRVLGMVEWVEGDDGLKHCPWCGGAKPYRVRNAVDDVTVYLGGHTPDCEWVRAMR